MLNRENIINKNPIKDCNGYNFEELSNIPKINLRGNSSNKDFLNNVEKFLDLAIPIEPNTKNSNSKLQMIWLSPNEWLVEIYESKDFEKIFSNLENSLNSDNTAITDVTESRTILKLSGIFLFKLLSKFMVIDLEKTLHNDSSVAQTIFVKFPVLIIKDQKKNEKQSIYLHANRSHAQYIINLLVDGSKNINF
mgnify:FL=1